RVYDRGGDPCPVCGRPLAQGVIGQRSSFWCPACQR
ncbi:MAG: DNA-formamidopyrimidine glycosylase, partial [Gammaproteobacteria bacterium]|nr:DNA-formamidopyrimidine glycosylase [Gammaproteobacteria bacterium]